MARLSPDDYLRHLQAESARFREVLVDCDPEARVPSCPDWTAADLLRHLGGVQEYWATVLRQRPAGPPDDPDDSEPGRPESYAALVDHFDTSSEALFHELAGVDPAEETWTWSEDHTAGFVLRRQAHEALIHRVDAELAAGQLTAIDPVLAADGVDEVLDIMLGGTPTWGTFTGTDRYVRVDIAETDESLWVQLGRFTGTSPDGTAYDLDDINVVDARDDEPDVVVSGPAAALDAWMWRRADDTGITITGEESVAEHFKRCVDQAID